MAEHTQLIDAINIRTSVRAYDKEPIDDDTARQLSMTIDAVNMLADLNMQLVLNRPEVFAEANASGHLKNAANLIVIVGPKDDPQARERAGFYAERVALAATLRGLGTLWVGGSWDREEAAKHVRVTKNEEPYLGVVIGHPEHHLSYRAKSYDELVEFQRSHRPTKSFEQFTAGMSDAERTAAPDWFKAGVEAAMKAPSAMNRQPITFTYDASADTAAAHIDQSAGDGQALNDLGIAKLHFQIGAGSGEWAWGDGGLFIHK
ncbi:nitroreductase family protein [Bifidobacterium aerophilum]|uniref:Nitroreductase n=1 Tax=Bifidobacterium aerophilum TaxID=1798155 RepID=A0A6N9Z1Z5_9BIFI|nr:nitroreductase family protein [Bifidobacterium aerophilum]NEG88667.1 nitroreductase [Bifidobacterium aerophilum]